MSLGSDHVRGLLKYELDRARKNLDQAKAEAEHHKRELAASSGQIVRWAEIITHLEKELGEK